MAEGTAFLGRERSSEGVKASWAKGHGLNRALPALLPDWVYAIRRRSVHSGRVARKGIPGGARRGVDWRKTLKRWSRQGHLDSSLDWRQVPYGVGRLVVLWDVSGSMSPYRDWYFPWLYQMASQGSETQVFAFGTEVVNLSDHFGGSYPEALQSLNDQTSVWGSGTAIGEAFSRWNDHYGARLLGPYTTLAIISDGWDVGNPERLEAVLRIMAERSRKIVWINPLKATAGFEPKTRALKIALQYVEGIEAGTTIHALRHLAWSFGFSA